MAHSVVELTLLSNSATVDKDSNGQQFPPLAANALGSCASAKKMLKRKKTSSWWKTKSVVLADSDQDVRARLVKDVMKYVRVQDKYTALVSLLIKSQVFYKTFPHLRHQGSTSPVVDMPRTTKGKPFVPTTPAALENGEANCVPMSVSHQYPFCGVARLVKGNDMVCMNTSLKLGLDIVVFEKLRTDLYATVEDYLEVYRGSFTDWEWDLIHLSQSSDERLMKEFHLRWSMKEAYTKALGLGMYLEFCQFETKLDLVDDHCQSNSIWQTVSEEKEGIHLRACVTMDATKEIWNFYFLPLCDSSKTKEEAATGCVCICFGPLGNKCTNVARFQVRSSWTTLTDLIQWHNG